MSVTRNILDSWRNPMTVMRRLLAGGRREDRALMFLMGACFVIFLAQWPRLTRMSHEGAEAPLQAMLGGALFGWMFIAPLLFYGLAAFLRLVCVALRRPIGWFEARLALFWSLLAASPLWLLNGLLNGVLGQGLVTVVVGFAILAAFFWLLAMSLATAALEARAAKT
ncbi:MAG: YIP1 family protein [Alkalilacustris sp.]